MRRAGGRLYGMMDLTTFDAATMRWIWIGGGLLLILFEFAIPGLVAVFFGAAGILTGVLVALGLLDTLTAQVVFWVISSSVLFFTLREQVRRWFPALERYKPLQEEEEILGSVVDVVEEVGGEEPGRVRFQGTTWKAVSRSGVIAAGQRVKITGRDNLVLYVTPLSENE